MNEVTKLPQIEKRPADSHKGTFGKVLIIGGQVGMSGAPALAGMAALRSGAGLVRVATCKSILNTVAGFEPCFTTIPLCESHGEIAPQAIDFVLTACKESDIIAVGPGIGTGKGARTIVKALTEQNIRLVIDADGINCLAKDNTWIGKKKASIILTPHPGEMARLWKSVFRKPIPSERRQQAEMLAKETKSTVVLKGHSTIVADPDSIYTNSTGNPGMATAGSGDVLTGIIAALAGQGLDNFSAAQLGVYIHGLAGDIAAKKYGHISTTARDILKKLPKAYMQNV